MSDDPFSQCPSGCVCGVRELVAQAHEQGLRAAEDVDAAEMRALLTAVRSGYEAVRNDTRLPERRHQASAAWARAERELDVMETMLDEEQLRTVAALVQTSAREADRGRRRPLWVRRLRWPTIVGIGLFDVYYYNQVFRYLTSQTGDAANAPGWFGRLWEWTAALVPGIVLAIIIAVSGELIVRPLDAWRAAASSRETPRPVRWVLRFFWWLLPCCFVLLLLLVVGVWAGLRAKYVRPPSQGYPIASVMLLIIMLSLGAMAVKAFSADPAADKVERARRELWWRRRLYLRRSRRAARLIGNYDDAWSDLRTLRDDLVGLLRIKMLSAWEGFILRIRSLHRMTGNVTAHVPERPAAEAVIEPEFQDIPQPQMELGPLLEICRMLDDQVPATLRARKRDLDAEYARQLNQHSIPLPQYPLALPPGPSER